MNSSREIRLGASACISLLLHAGILLVFWAGVSGSPGLSGLPVLQVELAGKHPDSVHSQLRQEEAPVPAAEVRTQARGENKSRPAAPAIKSPAAPVLDPSPAPAPFAALATHTVPLENNNGGMDAGSRQGPARQVQLEFEVRSGPEGQLAGKAVAAYLSDTNGNYLLDIKEVVTDVQNPGGHLSTVQIAGRIGINGLSPEIFKAAGHLSGGLLGLSVSAGEGAKATPASGRLPDGLLDRQSLFYQFMHQPPQRNGRIPLSDGTKIEVFAYSLEGYENLQHPVLGLVQVRKFMMRAETSAETIELWLLPDQRFLPIRVRHTDSQGKLTEQLVLSLSTR